jgi:hypothetical protein
MSLALALLLVVFVLLVLLDAPIAVALGLSSMFYLLIADAAPLIVVAQRAVAGINSFTLLAIPLFLLAGLLMVHGGLAPRIIALCSALIGRRTGGLAMVMIIACMMFGSLSGSGVADVVAIGTMMLPAMKDQGLGLCWFAWYRHPALDRADCLRHRHQQFDRPAFRGCDHPRHPAGSRPHAGGVVDFASQRMARRRAFFLG